MSLTFGDNIQASATGGYGTGTASDRGLTGGVFASQPLREAPGDVGWQVSAQKQPGGTYADAAAEIRTGYGIPGVEVNSFAGQTTAYASLARIRATPTIVSIDCTQACALQSARTALERFTLGPNIRRDGRIFGEFIPG